MLFELGIWNAWWFSLCYLMLTTSILQIFPKWVRIRFTIVPNLGIYSILLYFNFLTMLISSIFIPIQFSKMIFIPGVLLLLLGMGAYSWSLFTFAITPPQEIARKHLYKYSRNPAYVSGHMIWLGVGLAANNILFYILIAFQVLLLHKQILAEEIYLRKKYGKIYLDYHQQTRRYF